MIRCHHAPAMHSSTTLCTQCREETTVTALRPLHRVIPPARKWFTLEVPRQLGQTAQGGNRAERRSRKKGNA